MCDRAGILSRLRLRQGLTLVELMLAMVILAGGLAGVIRAYMKCLEARQLAQDQSVMVFLAENIMEQALASDGLSDVFSRGERTGRFPAPNDQFSWRVRILPSENEYSDILEVSCFNEKQPVKRNFILTSYVKRK